MSKDKKPQGAVINPPPKSVCDLGKPDYLGPQMIGSINMDSEAGKLAFLNCRSEPDFKAADMNGEIFKIENWIVSRQHYDGKEDEEERDGIRIALIDPEGRILGCSSDALGRGLDDLFIVRGRGPYDPPVGISLTPATTGGGRRTYKIRWV